MVGLSCGYTDRISSEDVGGTSLTKKLTVCSDIRIRDIDRSNSEVWISYISTGSALAVYTRRSERFCLVHRDEMEKIIQPT